MPRGQGNKAAWSDAEKLSVLFQIIEQVGTIDWDNINLPENRTEKAAKNMVKTERAKISGDETATGTKKRSAAAETESDGPEKKSKVSKAGKNAAQSVKDEPEEDGFA